MTKTLSPNAINEMLVKNTFNSYRDRLTDLTINIENEIIRLLQLNNIEELTFTEPIPMVTMNNKIVTITAIKIDTSIGHNRYYELEFKINGNFVKVDDFPQTSNLFRVPYMEMLIETINTIHPDALD